MWGIICRDICGSVADVMSIVIVDQFATSATWLDIQGVASFPLKSHVCHACHANKLNELENYSIGQELQVASKG